MAARNPLTRPQAALKKLALAYPETVEDHPWGESAFKVRGKVFLFLSLHEGKLRATTKLPASGRYALTQPFASPTGYGLGKSGWVTCTFDPGDAVPLDLLEDWIGESFRAVAPKKLVAAMDQPSG
jgi:predicted DNA-binding protein (MmcQ/YjbR family)